MITCPDCGKPWDVDATFGICPTCGMDWQDVVAAAAFVVARRTKEGDQR